MQYFRMNPSSEEPSRLLTDEGQWTEPWGSSDDGAPCDKCRGQKRVRHECWSCQLAGTDDSCPVCGGAVRWEANCPVCRGSGQVDGAPRHGVSVFPRLEGLYRYMLIKDADLDDCVIVELEAEPADDVDFDADQGAMLVVPRSIVACADVDRELVDRIAERTN
jgi:hypothetical protein